MTEYKLFSGDTPHVSTSEFHQHRERAPHLEQAWHRGRLQQAAEFVQKACLYDGEACSVSDLGCGDGGLLSILQNLSCVVRAWGYDFQPSNQAGWEERGITAYAVDVFNPTGEEYPIQFGRISVTTEVLEHLANPHEVLRGLATVSNFLVASSPFNETNETHDECHAWAWDMEGYYNLLTNNGWTVQDHVQVDSFQVIWAVRS